MLWFWCVLRFGKHSSYNHFRFWCEEFLNFWVYHHFLDCCLGLVIGIAKTPWFACLKPKLFLAKQYAFYKFCIFSCSELCKSMFSVALWYLQCNQQNKWIPVLTTRNAHDLFQKKSLYTWFPYWKDVKIPIQITMHCQISFFYQLRPCTFPFMLLVCLRSNGTNLVFAYVCTDSATDVASDTYFVLWWFGDEYFFSKSECQAHQQNLRK